jgi:hypothetical protein
MLKKSITIPIKLVLKVVDTEDITNLHLPRFIVYTLQG